MNYINGIQPLDKASQYNKVVCEGILFAQSKQYEQSLAHFKTAQKILANKMEPYFYQVMVEVRSHLKAILSAECGAKRSEVLSESLKKLEAGEKLNKNCAALYYHKGVVNFALGNTNDCINDLEKAIDKSEDNIPQYFYVKGLAYGCQKMYKQAVNDLTIAINLDEKFSAAYLNRAKCFHLVGDRNAAFIDLQKYIQIKPNDTDIHLWAGNLLFNIGAYEDAVKAYSHVANSPKSQMIFKLRSYCFVVLKELNNALSDMQKIIDASAD